MYPPLSSISLHFSRFFLHHSQILKKAVYFPKPIYERMLLILEHFASLRLSCHSLGNLMYNKIKHGVNGMLRTILMIIGAIVVISWIVSML